MSLPAFSAFGIELEYMIVERGTLDVRPYADRLLHALAGRPASSVNYGTVGWSNELVRHVIELKNVEPTPAIDTLAQRFQDQIVLANRALGLLDAQLMPGGMHPWMNPTSDTQLWDGDANDIYAAYHRIFNCYRHGYANLQSMHINLPFADDAQFARLHAAVRLVLPLVPALAASSPLAEGEYTGFADYRLEAYRSNAGKLATITGEIVPDTVSSRAQYERNVLAPMYREIEPLDPDGILRHEWLNSRGAIARFDRNAIEVRLADTQESPRTDLAIAAAVIEVVRTLYSERWSTLAHQQGVPTATLVEVLLRTMRDAEAAVIDDHLLLSVLGIRQRQCTARDVWMHWIEAIDGRTSRSWWRPAIECILNHGTLARRIVRALDGRYERKRIRSVYAELCRCLAEGRMFN
jgi:gamma-glutamyl:cysteine ligase YbdK (ATP-grasp superfamily)